MSHKVALVTGASSGIGMATAGALHDRGYTVYAAARRVDRMSGLADRGMRTLASSTSRPSAARSTRRWAAGTTRRSSRWKG